METWGRINILKYSESGRLSHSYVFIYTYGNISTIQWKYYSENGARRALWVRQLLKGALNADNLQFDFDFIYKFFPYEEE